MRRKEGNMDTRDNSVNLIRLLASYRCVEFPQNSCAKRTLIQLAAIIESNCEATIRFTSSLLRSLQHDGELLFSLCSLRQDALVLRRLCRAEAARNGRMPHMDHKVVTLRSQYDTFMNSVTHLFFLLDQDLAGRVEGALKHHDQTGCS